METILGSLQETVIQRALITLADLPSEIRWFGDPVLRKTTIPYSIDEIEAGVDHLLIRRMASVLEATNRCVGLGRGLAAPQVGVSRRVFVIFDRSNGSWQAYVNPKIIAKSDELGTYREMCVSALPITGQVVRPWEIEFEYFDEHGRYHRIAADPMLSRLAQHEIDHLDGILFTDRMEIKTISFEYDFEAYKSDAKLKKCPTISV